MLVWDLVQSPVKIDDQVDLEDTVKSLEGTIYEPDQFPGLIYHSKDLKEVILIFASGKLVCAGARSEADVPKAIDRLHRILVDRL